MWRLNPYTVGWEGEMQTYSAGSPRIRAETALILDDTVMNLWASGAEPMVGIRIDGQPREGSRRLPQARRDLRNSTFATGLLTLGDRHIVEVIASGAKLAAVDAKTVLGRQWIGVESPRWRLGELRSEAFDSRWGAPFGARQVLIPAGQTIEIQRVCGSVCGRRAGRIRDRRRVAGGFRFQQRVCVVIARLL